MRTVFSKVALITGGTGFVGSNIAHRLVREGWNVNIISIPGDNYILVKDILNKIKVYEHDGSTENMYDIVADAHPTVVFHLASLFLAQHAPRDIKNLIQSNILFGTQLVDAMISKGVYYLINTGTSWQHFENKEYSPACLYAATKQAYESILEYYIEAELLKVITLKLLDTYGPNDPRPKLFTLLRRFAHENKPLHMSPGQQLIDLVYIDDVVEAYLIAGEALVNNNVQNMETYAVSSGKPVSLKELVALYSRISGNSPQIVWGGRPYRSREVMVPWKGGRKLSGWEPKVGLIEGIKNIINYKEDSRLC